MNRDFHNPWVTAGLIALLMFAVGFTAFNLFEATNPPELQVPSVTIPAEIHAVGPVVSERDMLIGLADLLVEVNDELKTVKKDMTKLTAEAQELFEQMANEIVKLRKELQDQKNIKRVDL